jgi:hypothetical protein
MRRAALLLIALGAFPAAMQAQMCVGQAPWSAGKMKAGGELEFDGGTIIAGELGFGKDRGMFFGVGGGIATDGGTDGLVQGGLGWELSKPIADKLELCPVVNARVIFGDGATAITPMGGVSVGYPVTMHSSNVGLILTGAFQVGFTHVSGATDGFGLLDAGVGFIFNNRISLVPQIRIPIASAGSDVGLLIRANVAVGKH